MPTTYAHYRFGREVLQTLPEEAQRAVNIYLDLFNFGVHGPDLLFYYRPLSKNHVNRTGYEAHERTGRDFFTEALAAARRSPARGESLTYLYGVLCHFILDRFCHPYVAEKEQDGVSHSLIESSFDRYLMLRDGLDPITHRVTAHLHPSEHAAGIIAPYYPALTTREIYEAQKSMVLHLNLLIAKGPKRLGLATAMNLAGRPGMLDMFVPYTRDPRCADSDGRLFDCYEEALRSAPGMFRELAAAYRGEGELGPLFDPTFGEN